MTKKINTIAIFNKFIILDLFHLQNFLKPTYFKIMLMIYLLVMCIYIYYLLVNNSIVYKINISNFKLYNYIVIFN